MRKHFFFLGVVAFLMLLPARLFAQSTEGTDFWVTLLRGDEQAYDELSLTFAAKKATYVYVENAYTGLHDTIFVAADTIARDTLCNDQLDREASCYVTDDFEEVACNRALHVTSDEPISLIAANYKDKSFDVAAILPTPALMSEYRIQCYPPTAHSGNAQGSHFAIVAADDNVIVDITPTVATQGGHAAGVTFNTDTLKKGQVYYVWTGYGEGDSKDFTGTVVKARDNKKIAVFNGNPHTNIPDGIRDRDHIFSQAMPVNYWGKRFAITSSLTTIDGQADGTFWERIDKIRVQALVDGTVVRIDGDSVYTFDFATNPKHVYEFDFGANDAMTNYSGDGHRYFEGAGHYVETSCPSAVHLFMTSDRYDHEKIKNVNDKYCNGDPSEIWVNPIEQKITKLTFGTFETKQVKDHFINIVTTADNKNSVVLDTTHIGNLFVPFPKNPEYVYARITNVENKAHTLVADSGFIAHVYGFGEKESYGYPAGGETKDLTAFVTINGTVYKPGEDNLICGDDKVVFGCELNYEYDSIYWSFGDEKDSVSLPGVDSIEHYYEKADLYKAYVLIYRHMGDDDGCINFTNKDSISFLVNIGNFKVDIKGQHMPECTQQGDEVDFLIYLDNPAGVSLTSDSVKFTFTQQALIDGFKNSSISVKGDTMLIVHLPSTAKNETQYGLHLHIGSACPNSVLDKDLEFMLKFDIPLLAQRFNNVLGLIADSIPANQIWDNFYWKKDDEVLPDEWTSVLVIEEDEANNGEYRLCYTIHEEGKKDTTNCTCPVTFEANPMSPAFQPETDSIAITATYAIYGDKVFVNADYDGQTDIECYAQWITPSGNVYNDMRFDIPDGGCTIPVPNENGFYILRVITDKQKRNFKMIINK